MGVVLSGRGETLAVIPARGGSKGILRKNLCRVGGLPLVARTIRAALRAASIDRVIVSTDDEEIAGVARAFGAEVVRRPDALSGDAASSESALEHVLDTLAQDESAAPDVLVLLQCTAPFTTAADIDGTVAAVHEGADAAFAAVPFAHFLWRRDGAGFVDAVNHDGGPRQRRQDIAPQYLEAGSVYAMRVSAFREAGHRFCGRVALHEVDAARCFEIDTPEELAQAQQLAPVVLRTEADEVLPAQIGAVVFDFDGVFTENGVWLTQDGIESVRCSRGDGLGIGHLRATGIPLLVVSKERNPVVQERCEKLQLPVIQGVDDKRRVVGEWLAEQSVPPEQVIYIGNDTNDLPCLEWVGCAVGPADSHPDILGALHLVLTRPGGHNAVRELCDLILARVSGGGADD